MHQFSRDFSASNPSVSQCGERYELSGRGCHLPRSDRRSIRANGRRATAAMRSDGDKDHDRSYMRSMPIRQTHLQPVIPLNWRNCWSGS